MSPLVQSLWITLIGMGLVFIAILLLWGLMEGLMRLSARFVKEEVEESEEQGEEEVYSSEPVLAVVSDQKKRAAAAAVAIALALRKPVGRSAAAQTGGTAWQAVTRASQLNQATHITRKPRGSVR
jgi:sodium pump decarboxylase gamma subunit